VPHALPHRECVSPDERLPGMKVRSAGRMARRSCRPQRVNGFSCCSVRRPPALPQSARALAAPSESVCCIDDVARARVSRKILFENRQRPAHNQPRSPRSHEVRVRSAQSCLTQLARLNLAAGRQSARRRSHALTSRHRQPPPASRSPCGAPSAPRSSITSSLRADRSIPRQRFSLRALRVSPQSPGMTC